MKEIDLIPGAGAPDAPAAFDRAKMDAFGIDSMILSRVLSEALSPFAALLREGCGVGVIDRGGEVSVIGIAATSKHE